MYEVTSMNDLTDIYGQGETKEQAILDARECIERKMEDNCEFGEFTEDYTLVNLETDEQEIVTIEAIVYRDNYDGGRADYYGSRL